MSDVTSSCPSFGRELVDLPVGGRGQAREDVTQVREGIESATAAALDDGVEDGAAFPGLGFANEQPILFAESSGSNGVLYAEVSIMPRRRRLPSCIGRSRSA